MVVSVYMDAENVPRDVIFLYCIALLLVKEKQK